MIADKPADMRKAHNAQKERKLQSKISPIDTDILIIGGGLSGLALARHLAGAGRDWRLLEARGRWGGRILSERPSITTSEERVSGLPITAAYDLGPAWFWPGQPRIDRLVDDFGLWRFEQAHRGAQIFEDAQGGIHRGRGMAAMQGSYRLEGGFAALIAALSGSLPADRLYLDHPVTTIRRMGAFIEVLTRTGRIFRAHQVVLAVPPRLAAALEFEPALPGPAIEAARQIPTWMAGHAKAVALYDHPFWRDAGLSGDAQSQRGPLIEIHDASPITRIEKARIEKARIEKTCIDRACMPNESAMTEAAPALFGFIGTPPDLRERYRHALTAAIADQLGRVFGPRAAQPSALLIKDWAFSEWTATGLDQQPLYAHPSYGRPAALRDIWDARLHFASSEMATTFGGYLEGALEAAEEIAKFLQRGAAAPFIGGSAIRPPADRPSLAQQSQTRQSETRQSGPRQSDAQQSGRQQSGRQQSGRQQSGAQQPVAS